MLVLNFTIIKLAPGDPVSMFGGEYPGATAEYLQELRQHFGLDKPLLDQFLIYARGMLSGDFGYSFYYGEPVLTLILEAFKFTLLLMVPSLIFASVIGIFLGVHASKKPFGKLDNFITLLSLTGYSMPVFWLGQIFLLIFALKLGWFPAVGIMSSIEVTGIAYVIDLLYHLALPVAVVTIWQLALICRLTRSSMIEALSKDFIITAQAKGLDERTIVYRHALRNALIPVVTLITMNMGLVLAGAIVTETVFGLPGVGRLLIAAILSRDYPIVMGLLFFISLSVLFFNIVADIAYVVVDPRIRYSGRS